MIATDIIDPKGADEGVAIDDYGDDSDEEDGAGFIYAGVSTCMYEAGKKDAEEVHHDAKYDSLS